MRSRYDEICKREKALRIEATTEIRNRRVRVFQIAQEATQNLRAALPIEKLSQRAELRQIQSEPKREPTRWPDRPTTPKGWYMPPKGTEIGRDTGESRVQVDNTLKRTRDGENIESKRNQFHAQ